MLVISNQLLKYVSFHIIVLTQISRLGTPYFPSSSVAFSTGLRCSAPTRHPCRNACPSNPFRNPTGRWSTPHAVWSQFSCSTSTPGWRFSGTTRTAIQPNPERSWSVMNCFRSTLWTCLAIWSSWMVFLSPGFLRLAWGNLIVKLFIKYFFNKYSNRNLELSLLR